MSKTNVSPTDKSKEKFKKDSTNNIRIIESLKAVGIALLVGLFLIIVTGQANLIGDFFVGFWTYNFSSSQHFTDWLATISYLIPLGLAMAVSFRMGLFNIGSAGQAIAGGTAAYVVGSNITILGKFGFIQTIFVGVIVGASVALIIAMLKNRYNINEVISSIMLNWVIFYLVKYIVTPDSTSINSIYIDSGNDLRFDFIYSIFKDSSPRMNLGFFISIPLVFIMWYLYKKTNWGIKQDIIGNNPNSSLYLGLNKNNEIYKTMAISGALAGLAGTIYYCGYDTNLMHYSSVEIPAWSFNGITIALLGFNSPIGIMFSSCLLALFNPSIDNIIGSVGILDVVVAIMVILIAMSNYRITYGKRKWWFMKGGK